MRSASLERGGRGESSRERLIGENNNAGEQERRAPQDRDGVPPKALQVEGFQKSVNQGPGAPRPWLQAASTLFYCTSSLLIIFANKVCLTHYGFPSYFLLAFAQFTCTVVIIGLLGAAGLCQIKHLGIDGFVTIAPVTLLFGLNVVAGLGGTQKISLPMFTVLRRFGILMTMLLEQHMGGTKAGPLVWLSVVMMILGAVTAAMYDLTFDLTGYALIMMANFLTAGYGVAIKLTLAKINTTSLLFYNSVFSLLAMASLLTFTQMGMAEIEKTLAFDQWRNPHFVAVFILASIMGLVLNYATYMCVRINSALTTAVAGCLKNVLTAFVGMMPFAGGYAFSWLNFMGLNVSTMGGVLYSWAKFQEGRNKAALRV